MPYLQRRVRLAHGTLSEIAAAYGCHPSHVSLVVKGDRPAAQPLLDLINAAHKKQQEDFSNRRIVRRPKAT